MGLFKDRAKKKQLREGVLSEFERDMHLAQQLQQQAMASGLVDPKVASQVMAGAGQPGAVQEMQAYGARVARLYQVGVETPAALRSIEMYQNALAPGSASARLELTVEPSGGAAYEVSTDQVMAPSMAEGLVPGQHVTVKVDPNDPQSLMIWAVASPATAAPAPAPAEDRIERLSKLQDLRTSGVLTEEEFQAQKAKVLGEGPAAP
jgi:hypothetical protein